MKDDETIRKTACTPDHEVEHMRLALALGGRNICFRTEGNEVFVAAVDMLD